MRILVTGGAGFIGSHVADICMRAGHEVCVLDDLSTGLRERISADLLFHRVDIRNAQAVHRVIEAFHPEVVSHHAARVSAPDSLVNPQDDASVNVLGTLTLLQAIREVIAECGFVFASSAAVYGECLLPASETAQMAPQNPYAAAKVAAEQYVFSYARTHGLLAVILRYGNAFGSLREREGGGVISRFLNDIRSGESSTIFGNGEQTRDFIHVSDIARANLAAIEYLFEIRPNPTSTNESAFNIASGKQTSIMALHQLLSDLLGCQDAPTHKKERQGEIFASWLDVEKARRVLGFASTTSLREGLGRLIADRWDPKPSS